MKELFTIAEKNAKDFEIFSQSSEINEVHLERGKMVFENKVFHSGYGVRVFKKGLGFSASNIKSKEEATRTVLKAIKCAEMSEKVEFSFPSHTKFPEVEAVDRNIKGCGEEAVREYAERLLAEIPKNVLLSFGKIRTYDTLTSIINSAGLEAKKEETNFMVELSLIVEKNGVRTEFWPHEYRRRLDGIPMSKIDRWIKIAKDQTIAKEPRTEKAIVVFSPMAVLDGLGTVIDAHAVGSAKVNETTKFSIGEKVATEDLTIFSDGLYPFGLMTGEFDDEGNPQTCIPIIENGIFKNFLYDQFYGIKDGKGSTGNGFRQSDVFFTFDERYAAQPTNQSANFHVKAGDVSYDEMISNINHGLLVEQFSWLNPDSVTGKFSSEIRAGYYIEKGEIGKPVKGGLVVGNIFDMIKNINSIGNKSEIVSGGNFFAGVCPYIAFNDLQIAGKVFIK